MKALIDKVSGHLEATEITWGYLYRYFDHPWNIPISYYNPLSFYIYLEKVKEYSGIQMNPDCRILENELIVAYFGHPLNELHLYAVKSKPALDKFLKRVSNKLSCQIKIFIPNFQIPEDQAKLVTRRKQLIYSCKEVVNKIEADLFLSTSQILNARAKSTFRRNLREIKYGLASAKQREHIEQIIHQWSDGRSAKSHERVDLFKAHIALNKVLSHEVRKDVLTLIGYRGEIPVSFSIISVCNGRERYASQIITKSLNYKSQKGGYNGTGIWEIYQSCKVLVSLGIDTMNASAPGNHKGLTAFKSKFTDKSILAEGYILKYE